MSARIHQLPVDSSSMTSPKKRRTVNDEFANQNAAGIVHDGGSRTDHNARRRWKLVQKHVSITQWLSKDLVNRQLKKFSLSQESLVDAVMASNDDIIDMLIKIREQFLSLLDAENCILSIDARPSVLEFDGQSIYPSFRAKGGLLREALSTGRIVHMSQAASDETLDDIAGATDLETRSYLCVPLVDAGQVQGVVEVFNYRLDAQLIDSWLRDAPISSEKAANASAGSLLLYRNFVGKLMKGITKRCNFNDVFSLATSKAMNEKASSHRGSVASDSGRRRSSVRSSMTMIKPPISFEQSIEKWVELLHQTVSVGHVTVYAFDKDSGLLWARHPDKSLPASALTLKSSFGVAGRVIAKRRHIHLSAKTDPCIEEAYQEILPPTFCSDDDFVAAQDLLSVLYVPTFDVNDQVNGVVLMQNKKKTSQIQKDFDAADIAMSLIICRRIGTALYSSQLHEAIGKAQGKAQTLLDLSAVLFRELETKSLLVAIMDAIRKPMNAGKCGMFLMDEEQNELYSPVGYSDIERDLSDECQVCRISAEEGIIGAAARTGEVINVHDAYSDARFCQRYDLMTGFRTRSVLAVPIKDTNGKVVGVLEMLNKLSKQYFDKDDEELAKGIAYYLAIALNNARLFENARCAMRRSDALLAMMQVISSNESPASDVFQSILDKTCQILNAQHAALFFVDELSRMLSTKAGTNWKGYTFPIGTFFQGKAAKHGQIVVLGGEALREDPDFDTHYESLINLQFQSLLCVPVKTKTYGPKQAKERVIAVFQVANKLTLDPGRSVADDSETMIATSGFNEEDVKILSALCTEISSVIERRVWELDFHTFQDEAGNANDQQAVTSAFLSQYTKDVPVARTRPNKLNHYPSAMEDDSSVNEIQLESSSSFPPGSFGFSISSPRAPSDLSTSSAIEQQARNFPHICESYLDPWMYSPGQLVDFIVEMFEFFDLPLHFRVPKATLRRFIVSIKGQYQDLPYHNFYHAFTTLHVSFTLVRKQNPGRKLFASKELLAIFIAAYCHDVNHNGRTNDFHIRYRTSIAMMYNDQSVLENMHSATCFETMRRPGNDVLEHVDPVEYRYIRKCIIRAILATDMHNHAAIVSSLHEKLRKEVYNPEDEAHKELLINAIVHSADISNPTFPGELHAKWSLQILQEFNMQYQEELALEMNPTPYMNAKPHSAEQGKLNLAFIDSCVFPLWSIMSSFLDGLDGCLENIQHNRVIWIKQMDSMTATEPPLAPSGH